MVPIYIPSKGRAKWELQTTLQQLPPIIRKHATVVVHESEHEEYWTELASRGHTGIICIDAVGINPTRQTIGRMAAQDGHSHFIMLDDDLTFFRRRAADDTRLVKTGEDDRVMMFEGYARILTSGKYAAVGISARQGNNTLVWPLVENTRMIRTLGFETAAFNDCKHDRVPVMEDFDVLLQLLRKGRDIAVISQYAQDQKQTQADGGCSTYRTHAMQEAAVDRMVGLHGDFVKKRFKENKTGGEFGRRAELTIYWKKARASAS